MDTQNDFAIATPPETAAYALAMHGDDGTALQWIEITRTEFMVLKGCLSTLRGMKKRRATNARNHHAV